MAKTKNSNSEIYEVDEIPERLKPLLKTDQKLFHLKTDPNISLPPKVDGYVLFAVIETGFYYTEY